MENEDIFMFFGEICGKMTIFTAELLKTYVI